MVAEKRLIYINSFNKVRLLMHLHPQTLGHVSYATLQTRDMEHTEEAHEMIMLSCRYGRRRGFLSAHIALCQSLAQMHNITFNPNTRLDIEAFFQSLLPA